MLSEGNRSNKENIKQEQSIKNTSNLLVSTVSHLQKQIETL